MAPTRDRLIRHEVVLDLTTPWPDMSARFPVVKFSAVHHLAATVELPVVRWMDMGSPDQIKVTVEPVVRKSPTNTH